MTSGRWILLVLILAAAGVGVWIARNSYWDYEKEMTPLKGDALTNPYYTFEHLAQRLGVRTSQVDSLKKLPAPSGVLMLSDGHMPSIRNGLDDLQHWVEAGGRLIVPSDVLLASPGMQSWSGVSRASHEAAKEDDDTAGDKRTGRGNGNCPSLTERVAGKTTGVRYGACIETYSLLGSKRFPAWSLSNQHGTQMLRVDIGKGSLAVIVCECVIGNESLLKADHARLVYAAAPIVRGDLVSIFDPQDSAGILALLWRAGAAAIVCAALAVALAIWRHLPRFGALAPEAPLLRRSLAEQIRARAQFAWRTRKIGSLRLAVRAALHRAANRLVPGYGRMQPSERIRALSALSGLEPSTLNHVMAEEFGGAAEAELDATALLEKTRRNLLLKSTISNGVRI